MALRLGTMLCICVLLQMHTARATEEDPVRKEARDLADQGGKAYLAGDFNTASKNFERAWAMLPVPSIGLYSARALVKLRRLVEAEQRYQQVAQLGIASDDRDKLAKQEEARKEASEDLARLKPRIPTLRVQAVDAPIEEFNISIDDVPFTGLEAAKEHPVDPGEHRVVGVHGSEVVRSTVDVEEGEHAVATVRLEAPKGATADAPAKAPHPAEVPLRPDGLQSKSSWTRTAGVVTMVTGGAMIAFSGVSALAALGAKPSDCAGNVCSSSVDTYRTWRTISTVTFWSGAAVGVTGAVLFFAAPSSRNARRVGISVGPTSIYATGAF